jgi:hypothetical protein
MTATYPGFTATAALAPRGAYRGAATTTAADPRAIQAAQGECDTACCVFCTECMANPYNEYACFLCLVYCRGPSGPIQTQPPRLVTR